VGSGGGGALGHFHLEEFLGCLVRAWKCSSSVRRRYDGNLLVQVCSPLKSVIHVIPQKATNRAE
jgi:hypothetical protein